MGDRTNFTFIDNSIDHFKWQLSIRTNCNQVRINRFIPELWLTINSSICVKYLNIRPFLSAILYYLKLKFSGVKKESFHLKNPSFDQITPLSVKTGNWKVRNFVSPSKPSKFYPKLFFFFWKRIFWDILNR